MTSNVGSEKLSTSAETESDDFLRDRGLEALREHFPPEFLNRVDEVLHFHRLKREHISQIVDIQLRVALKRLAEHRIEGTVTPAARDLLADVGYDVAYGARPLKRAIGRMVLNPLASQILAGNYRPGDQVIVDAEGHQIVFREPSAVVPPTIEANGHATVDVAGVSNGEADSAEPAKRPGRGKRTRKPKPGEANGVSEPELEESVPGG
jgi:ATP-dependent Clp protease ATP-binding subunit ClpB